MAFLRLRMFWWSVFVTKYENWEKQFYHMFSFPHSQSTPSTGRWRGIEAKHEEEKGLKPKGQKRVFVQMSVNTTKIDVHPFF